ncbi:ATP-dependent DNA ligase [Alicyclobacillus sendaiensis]|uniref:ATP-dependent DNA ligase n=1 Tax=Alicyclobacillus sendaiensis TaxID=192387 RepID=UPI000782A448|nr:DNA ligase [Alicyclobacillus sendaiensis]
MPFFRPFEPVSSPIVPTGDGWIAQVKWDGVRAVTEVSSDGVEIWNRHGRPRTHTYPEIVSALRPFRGCAFDGEVVALTRGKPDFYRLLRRDQAATARRIERLMAEIPVWYAVFDVVRIDGTWIGDWPLAKRLDWLLANLSGLDHVLATEGVEDPAALFAATKQLGLEGIVCKRVDSTYAPGQKDGRWVKVKHARHAIAAVGGVLYRDGAPNALMLGLYDDQARLFHVGNAGAGRLPRRAWIDVVNRVLSHETPIPPFARAPKPVSACRFAHPVVAVKVRFAEWTPHKTMRHPVLLAALDFPATPAACAFAQADP